MSGAKTLIWAVLLVALGAFYYFYEVEGGAKREEAAKQRELLVSIVPDDVEGLTLQRAQETVRAVKREGHWHLTEPLAVAGDAQKYREIVRSLADLRQTRVVEEQPQSLEPFGLTTPRLDIQVTLKNQSTPVSIRLGAANPTGSSYYAQVAGRPAVYLVSAMAKDMLDVPLHALRDKTVLTFTPSDVHDLQMTIGAAPAVTLQRQEGETWRLTAPVNAKADDQQVKGLLQRLRDVKVQAFLAEEATDLASYGLEQPAAQFVVRHGQHQTEETLLLGNLDAERKGVYAKRSDAARVFLLPQDFWDNLPKTATGLRDKTLLKFERDHVARLERHTPGETLLITQTGQRQYAIEQPKAVAGDGDAIYSLLWDVRELKIKEFVAEAPATYDAYGLTTPRLRLTLWEKPPTAPDTTQHMLLMGADAADGQGVYVMTSTSAAVYLVGSAEAQRLLAKTAFDLQYKKLLSFTSETIQKIQVRYPTEQFTVERQGKDWKLSAPTKQEITQRWKIDQVLYELSTLEYAKIVTEAPVEPSAYGLNAPQTELTLWTKDGTVVGPLVLGKTTETEIPGTQTVYAQVGTQTVLYALKTDFLKGLPKTAMELTAEK